MKSHEMRPWTSWKTSSWKTIVLQCWAELRSTDEIIVDFCFSIHIYQRGITLTQFIKLSHVLCTLQRKCDDGTWQCYSFTPSSLSWDSVRQLSRYLSTFQACRLQPPHTCITSVSTYHSRWTVKDEQLLFNSVLPHSIMQTNEEASPHCAFLHCHATCLTSRFLFSAEQI